MSLDRQGIASAQFGEGQGDLDLFTGATNFRIRLGVGEPDYAAKTLGGSDDPEVEGVYTSNTPTVTLASFNVGDGYVAQTARIKASFSDAAGVEFTEIGLFQNGSEEALFLAPLSVDGGNTLRAVLAEDGESVTAEITLSRVLNSNPVVLRDDDWVKVELMPLFANGRAKFTSNFSHRNDAMYRADVNAPLIAANGVTLDNSYTITARGDIEYVFDAKLYPPDAFYDPSTLDVIQEIWFGTDNINVSGLVHVTWKEPLVRPDQYTYHVRVPVRFKMEGDTWI